MPFRPFSSFSGALSKSRGSSETSKANSLSNRTERMLCNPGRKAGQTRDQLGLTSPCATSRTTCLLGPRHRGRCSESLVPDIADTVRGLLPVAYLGHFRNALFPGRCGGRHDCSRGRERSWHTTGLQKRTSRTCPHNRASPQQTRSRNRNRNRNLPSRPLTAARVRGNAASFP